MTQQVWGGTFEQDFYERQAESGNVPATQTPQTTFGSLDQVVQQAPIITQPIEQPYMPQPEPSKPVFEASSHTVEATPIIENKAVIQDRGVFSSDQTELHFNVMPQSNTIISEPAADKTPALKVDLPKHLEHAAQFTY